MPPFIFGTKNISSIISSHNKAIWKTKLTKKGFAIAEAKASWTFYIFVLLYHWTNKCLSKSIVYKAEVINDDNNENKIDIGLISSTFKERYTNHNKSFTHAKYKTETQLSNYIWSLTTLQLNGVYIKIN